MKIGAYQFKATNSINDNYQAILRGINEGYKKGIKILFFQECALTGYPPIEIENIEDIDFSFLEIIKEKLQEEVVLKKINILIGSINRKGNKYINCIDLIKKDGSRTTVYSKKALWGWDKDNFISGNFNGIIKLENIKIGIRICYEIRFPEYFRTLFKKNIDLAFVAFNDTSENENNDRYNLIMSHIRTRAVENSFTIITVNSISKHQTAPTCVIDPDGNIISQLDKNIESLISYDFIFTETNFGRKGRIEESRKLLHIK